MMPVASRNRVVARATTTAPIDVLYDSAPLPEVAVHHPVYEFVNPLVYEFLGVGHHLSLEALAHLLLPQQLAEVHQPDVLLQPGVAPLVEGVDDILDLGHP